MNCKIVKVCNKSVLVKELGFTTVKNAAGDIVATVPVMGQAGILNIATDGLEPGQILTNLRFTDEYCLTPAGINKQKNREPLGPEDYTTLKRVVAG